MKIAVVGDIHSSVVNPRSRVDNYNESLFFKLSYILNYGIDTSLFLGDIFHKPKSTETIENRFITELLSAKSKGVSSYTILGNHDFYYNDVATLPKTAIYNIMLSDGFRLIQDTNSLSLGGFDILCLPYNIKDVPAGLDKIADYVKEHNSTDVVILGHHFFEWQLNLDWSITTDMLDKALSKCTNTRFYIFLGHDHQPHDEVKSNNWTVYRPGSLTRYALTDYALTQIPSFYLLDTDTKDVKLINIPCKTAQEVFNITAYKVNKKAKRVFADVQKRLQEIDFTKQTEQEKISETLMSMNTPKDEFEYLRSLHVINNQDF